VSVKGVKNRGPVLSLPALREPPVLVYALSKIYELLFMYFYDNDYMLFSRNLIWFTIRVCDY